MNDDRIAAPLKVTENLPSERLRYQQPIGRRKRRAAETRLRLIQSALQLIARRGFPGVTVEDITEAADVGKGTFYNYFESKDHILAAIAEIQHGTVSRALEEAAVGRRTIRSVLSRLASRMCEDLGHSPNLTRGILASLVTNNVVAQQIRLNLLEECRTVTEIIEIGQKRGEINSGLKRERLALLFQQSIVGALLLWSLRGELGLQDLVAENIQYFWRAVAPPRRVV